MLARRTLRWFSAVSAFYGLVRLWPKSEIAEVAENRRRVRGQSPLPAT
jgi:hypothetical protein